MITLKEYFEIVNYRITEGGDYGGYGPDNYSLTYWDGDQDGVSLNVVFNTKTQVVVLAEVCDYRNQRAYRRINPDYRKDLHEDTAWDDVVWCDLETDDDWIQKALAIVNYEQYDERVEIPLELPEQELMMLFKMAHERDMTFNDLVEQVIREYIDNHPKLKDLSNG